MSELLNFIELFDAALHRQISRAYRDENEQAAAIQSTIDYVRDALDEARRALSALSGEPKP